MSWHTSCHLWVLNPPWSHPLKWESRGTHQEFTGETRGQSPPAVSGSQDKDGSAFLAPRCLNLWHEEMQPNTGMQVLLLRTPIDFIPVHWWICYWVWLRTMWLLHGSSWAEVGYEQRDPRLSSVRATQLIPSKGDINSSCGSPVSLEPTLLWTQMHIKSSLATKFTLFLCNGRTNFWVVRTASSGRTRLVQLPSMSWFAAVSQAECLIKDGPAFGFLAFNIAGWESQQALWQSPVMITFSPQF